MAHLARRDLLNNLHGRVAFREEIGRALEATKVVVWTVRHHSLNSCRVVELCGSSLLMYLHGFQLLIYLIGHILLNCNQSPMRVNFLDFTVMDRRHLITPHIYTMLRILERSAVWHFLVKIRQALLFTHLAEPDLRYTVIWLRNPVKPAKLRIRLLLNTVFWPLFMCKCLMFFQFLMKFQLGLIPFLAFGSGFERLYISPSKVPPIAIFLQEGQ